jgi:hypothetical protein
MNKKKISFLILIEKSEMYKFCGNENKLSRWDFPDSRDISLTMLEMRFSMYIFEPDTVKFTGKDSMNVTFSEFSNGEFEKS